LAYIFAADSTGLHRFLWRAP